MRFRIATVAAIVLALLTGLSASATAATPDRVTWSGWRVAALGTNISDAAAALNKPLFTGCDPVIYIDQLPKGLNISNGIHAGGVIDDVTVTPYGSRKPLIPRIRGPLAIHVGMSIKTLKKSIKRHGLKLHNRYNAEAGGRGDYWVQNSDGHVLWFRLNLYSPGKSGNYTLHKTEVAMFSVTSSTADAFTAMGFQGGC